MQNSAARRGQHHGLACLQKFQTLRADFRGINDPVPLGKKMGYKWVIELVMMVAVWLTDMVYDSSTRVYKILLTYII